MLAHIWHAIARPLTRSARAVICRRGRILNITVEALRVRGCYRSGLICVTTATYLLPTLYTLISMGVPTNDVTILPSLML